MDTLSKHPFTAKYKTLLLKNNINTPLRISHFLGQADHESPGLKPRREGLNYSTESLIGKFGRHRISIQDANKYGRNRSHPANQNMIANTIYGGSWGKTNLGNIYSNDGWNFRGGGIFQITGRGNYTKLSKDTGVDFINNPGLIEDEVNSLIAAIWYWNMRNLSKYADADNSDAVSDLINLGKLTPRYGDSFGFADRRSNTEKMKRIFQ